MPQISTIVHFATNAALNLELVSRSASADANELALQRAATDLRNGVGAADNWLHDAIVSSRQLRNDITTARGRLAAAFDALYDGGGATFDEVSEGVVLARSAAELLGQYA